MINWIERKQDLSARIYNIPFANYYDLLDEEQRYVLDKIITQEQSMINKTLEKFADEIYNINPFNGGKQEGYAIITFTNLKKEIKKIIKRMGK